MRKMEMNNYSNTLTYMRLREKTAKEQEGTKIKGRLKIEKILRYNKIHTLTTFDNPFSVLCSIVHVLYFLIKPANLFSIWSLTFAIKLRQETFSENME